MDVTDATFQAQVLDRSAEVPVVVDLWAEWCGPCRTLTPIIEKAVAETGGRVELAKVDVDSNPEVARAFQVQSIPAVYALRDGKVVANFVGAQGEEAVRAFVQGLLPETESSPVERLVQEGDEASLRAALELEPDNADAACALAGLLIERDGAGDREGALELLGRIPETAATRHLAALARVEPVDDIEASLAELLGQVRTDDDARSRFLDLLDVMGPDDDRTAGWRRRLASAIY